VVKRQPTRVRDVCRLRRATLNGPFPATVRNISAEGIGLVTDRPFRPGMLLLVDLSSSTFKLDEPRLLRLTHAQVQTGNQSWALGGVLVRKLTRAELDAFKARSPAILRPTERRTTTRHLTRLDVTCRVMRAILDGASFATLRNVSPRGIGLITRRPYDVGTFVMLELPVGPQQLGEPRLLRIKHAEVQPDGKWWVLGGVFTSQLPAEELKPLL
jgi:hypothetical protein